MRRQTQHNYDYDIIEKYLQKLFTKNRAHETGKYFLDVSKLILGVYVFTSFPADPSRFLGGIAVASGFFSAGIVLIQKDKE